MDVLLEIWSRKSADATDTNAMGFEGGEMEHFMQTDDVEFTAQESKMRKKFEMLVQLTTGKEKKEEESNVSTELSSEMEQVDRKFEDCEIDLNNIREALYANTGFRIIRMPSENCDDDEAFPKQSRVQSHLVKQEAVSLPPMGNLLRPDPTVGAPILADFGQQILGEWKEAIVVSFDSDKDIIEVHYRVEVADVVPDQVENAQSVFITRRQMAYTEPSEVRLPVGTRIVAKYTEGFYPGIIAEPIKLTNKFRYLVFFDDGRVAYVSHCDVRVVSLQSCDVWEDVMPLNRDFVQRYLLTYPNRSVLALTVGQDVRTERGNGQWWIAQVLSVEASLVRLRFKSDGKKETIYRGSTRLAPVFLKHRRSKCSSGGIWNFPSVAGGHQQPKFPLAPRAKKRKWQPIPNWREKVRKNNMANNDPRSSQLGDEKILAEMRFCPVEFQGEVKPVEVTRVAESCTYKPHRCGKQCLPTPQFCDDDTLAGKHSPLLIPIVFGWKRQVTMRRCKGRRTTFYVAPCGMRLRSLSEVHRYLMDTESNMAIDFFNFGRDIKVFNEWKPKLDFINIPDISYGKENIPVPCVNALDSNFPAHFDYSMVRIPQKKVVINTDKDFLICCDCVDDCQDREKCACRQLTVQSTVANPEGVVHPRAGYSHRRLLKQVPTGIFECNAGCKCKKSCLNRVAQNPLRYQLQVFKTEKRGWGIRTLCDIPGGAFICIYVGKLYTNACGNIIGKDFGDEYFADLDFIEIVERRKDGYESDTEIDDSPDHAPISPVEENLSLMPPSAPDSNPATNVLREPPISTKKWKSTRRFFGQGETEAYVMDANDQGNIGRYMNHSCSPNVFVQNCFIDTHDPRFPWLAFFSVHHIQAGQELCWDYGYEVNQVEGKRIDCSCGASACRGRLL